jgi:hypothetical protein
MKMPGIIDIEVTGVRSKHRTITLTYQGKSKSVGLNGNLWLDELAQCFRELADWLEPRRMQSWMSWQKRWRRR